jgi:hypothetical protein
MESIGSRLLDHTRTFNSGVPARTTYSKAFTVLRDRPHAYYAGPISHCKSKQSYHSLLYTNFRELETP